MHNSSFYAMIELVLKKIHGRKKKMEEFKKDLLKVCGKNTAALIIFFVLGFMFSFMQKNYKEPHMLVVH